MPHAAPKRCLRHTSRTGEDDVDPALVDRRALRRGSYAGFWNTIAAATLRDFDADPGSMQVGHTITWDPEGERAPEDERVTLGLVRQGDLHLIDDEL